MVKVNVMSAVAAMMSCAAVQSVDASWFSSDFDGPERGTVIFTVFNATSLDDEDTYGDSDVFVRVEMDEPGIHITDPGGDSGYGVKDAIRGDDLYTWTGSNAYIVMKGVKDPMNSKLKIDVLDQDFLDTDGLGDYEVDMKDHEQIFSYSGKSFYETVDTDIFSRNGRLGFNIRVVSEDGVGAKSLFGGDDEDKVGGITLSMINCTGLDDEDVKGDSDVYVKVSVDEPGIHLTDPSGKSEYGIKDDKLGDELYRWPGELGKVVIEDVFDPLNSDVLVEVRDGDLIGSDDLGDVTIEMKKHKAVTSEEGKDFCEVVDRDLLNTGRCCFNIKVIANGDSKGLISAKSISHGVTTAPVVVVTLLAAVGAMLF